MRGLVDFLSRCLPSVRVRRKEEPGAETSSSASPCQRPRPRPHPRPHLHPCHAYLPCSAVCLRQPPLSSTSPVLPARAYGEEERNVGAELQGLAPCRPAKVAESLTCHFVATQSGLDHSRVEILIFSAWWFGMPASCPPLGELCCATKLCSSPPVTRIRHTDAEDRPTAAGVATPLLGTLFSDSGDEMNRYERDEGDRDMPTLDACGLLLCLVQTR